PTWPCALTPAAVSLSTAVATAALASSAVSSVRTTPVLVAISRSRRCSTHTSPLDSRARSRAAARARSEISEWSIATRILSNIALASQPGMTFFSQLSVGRRRLWRPGTKGQQRRDLRHWKWPCPEQCCLQGVYCWSGLGGIVVEPDGGVRGTPGQLGYGGVGGRQVGARDAVVVTAQQQLGLVGSACRRRHDDPDHRRCHAATGLAGQAGDRPALGGGVE